MAKTISMDNRTMRLPQEYVDAVSDGYYAYTNGGWYIKKEFLIDYPAELAEMMADICPGLAGSQLADYDVGLRCWPELLESGTVDAEVVKEELYMWVAYSKMQVHRNLGARELGWEAWDGRQVIELTSNKSSEPFKMVKPSKAYRSATTAMKAVLHLDAWALEDSALTLRLTHLAQNGTINMKKVLP